MRILHYISDVGSAMNINVKQVNISESLGRYLTNWHRTLGLYVVISKTN